MSKTSVLSRPKVNKSTPRNAFDRSRDLTFNLSAGMLLPLFWQQYPAGARAKFNANSFIRTASVNTAAFTPMDFHLEFYKVPLRYLWSQWNDFKLDINDVNSSAVLGYDVATNLPNQSPASSVPSFDVSAWDYEVYNNAHLVSPTTAWSDSVGNSYANGYLRLRELFRYGGAGLNILGMNSGSSQLGYAFSFRVNTFAAQAYQKIYYDHFRNNSYESNSAFNYNADWLGNVTLGNLSDSRFYEWIKNLHTLRYVNFRNDYYKNIYPALTYVASQPSGTLFSVPSSVLFGGNYAGQQNTPAFNSISAGQVIVNAPYSDADKGTLFTVQQIRAAFALDKLLRASSYAPKHVKEQFAARFGVKMTDRVSYESEYLGSFVNRITLREVVSTADTSSASLGAIGAKGVGTDTSGKTIETYCEEDCIIMAMGYVIPNIMYDARGADGWITKLSRNEFFQPEFENLGLEPVYQWEIQREEFGQVNHNNIIYGYRPRNQVYKLAPDLNYGMFRVNPSRFDLTGSVGSQTLTLNQTTTPLSSFTTHGNVRVDGLNTPSIVPATVNGLTYRYFKVTPVILNQIFYEQQDIACSPSKDQFFGILSVYDPSVQDMSVHGQPSL